MIRIKNLIYFFRPIILLLSVLTYSLGTGIANYLGHEIESTGFWLGLGWVILLQLSMGLFTEVFRPSNEPLIPDETLTERIALRNALLLIASVALISAVVIFILILITNLLTPSGLIIFSLSILAIFGFAVPPIRLVDRGFGEFTQAVLLANLIPSMGFLLQTRELHRLLFMVTFPLTALAMALFIILDFPNYTKDIKYIHNNLLTRLGWERTVPLHNLLVLSAYFLFAITPLLGLPWTIVWPVFLTLPFGFVQIIWLRIITLGGNPVWKFLTMLSFSVFGLTVYVLTITFWIR